jgi:hypothetical protein
VNATLVPRDEARPAFDHGGTVRDRAFRMNQGKPTAATGSTETGTLPLDAVKKRLHRLHIFWREIHDAQHFAARTGSL